MEKGKISLPVSINERDELEKLLPISESDNSSEGDNIAPTEDSTSKKRNTSSKVPNKKDKSAKQQSIKYHDDIVHILKYAEENNPHSLIIELCQNLKWTFPNIDSYQITENNINVYKTNIKLKNFSGEAIGITKKISKKKACTELLVNMISDKTVRDSLRMYIDTKSITRNCQLKEEYNDDDINLEEEFEKPVYKEGDLDSDRVRQIITDYNKDNFTNPLNLLDGFKNRFEIPVSFTYTIKEKLHKAVTYVGGKICKILKYNVFLVGIGVDANIRVAKYRAAEEAVKKIREKYGEESLKYKAIERRKNKLRLIEEEKNKAETSMEPISLKVLQFQSNEELLQNVNQMCDKNDLNSIMIQNLEIFLLKFERNSIPVQNYLEIHKFLSLIFYSNKTLCIHFSNPILAGSFLYDCPSFFNQVVDIIFYHTLKPEKIKDAIEMLIKKFKQLLTYISSDYVVNITNRINETNLDILVKPKSKEYSFRFLIRDDQFKSYIYYIKAHNTKVNNQVKFSINFNVLRRIFRIWRRHNKLNFLKPEILDWIIKLYLKDSLSSSIIEILHKCSKNLRNTIHKNSEIPDLLKEEFKFLSEDQISLIKSSFKNSFDAIINGEFNNFLKLN